MPIFVEGKIFSHRNMQEPERSDHSPVRRDFTQWFCKMSNAPLIFCKKMKFVIMFTTFSNFIKHKFQYMPSKCFKTESIHSDKTSLKLDYAIKCALRDNKNLHKHLDFLQYDFLSFFIYIYI